MFLINAIPRGDVQGGVAVMELRARGLDGMSETGLVTIAMTRHALIAQIKLGTRLLAEMDAQDTAEVRTLKTG